MSYGEQIQSFFPTSDQIPASPTNRRWTIEDSMKLEKSPSRVATDMENEGAFMSNPSLSTTLTLRILL
jgi:hypothetical protein